MVVGTEHWYVPNVWVSPDQNGGFDDKYQENTCQ